MTQPNNGISIPVNQAEFMFATLTRILEEVEDTGKVSPAMAKAAERVTASYASTRTKLLVSRGIPAPAVTMFIKTAAERFDSWFKQSGTHVAEADGDFAQWTKEIYGDGNP